MLKVNNKDTRSTSAGVLLYVKRNKVFVLQENKDFFGECNLIFSLWIRSH